MGDPGTEEWKNLSIVILFLKGTGGLFVDYSSIKLGKKGTGGPKISGI